MADTERARELRKKETWAEKLVWSWLRDRRFIGYKFRRQHPLDIYYLDFSAKKRNWQLNSTAASMVFPTTKIMMQNGKNFCNHAASRLCGSGIRICGGTHKASVTRYSMNCRHARRIHCRNIRGR
jgi:hypothetical protein